MYLAYFIGPSLRDSNKSNFTFRKINKKINENVRKINMIKLRTKNSEKVDEYKFRKTFNYNHQLEINFEIFIKRYIILEDDDFEYLRGNAIKTCLYDLHFSPPFSIFHKMKKLEL